MGITCLDSPYEQPLLLKAEASVTVDGLGKGRQDIGPILLLTSIARAWQEVAEMEYPESPQ